MSDMYRHIKKIRKVCKFCESEFFTNKQDKEFGSCECQLNYRRESHDRRTDDRFMS